MPARADELPRLRGDGHRGAAQRVREAVRQRRVLGPLRPRREGEQTVPRVAPRREERSSLQLPVGRRVGLLVDRGRPRRSTCRRPSSPRRTRPTRTSADPLVRFIRAVNDAPSAAAIEPWLDTNRFLTHLAVENAIAERDGLVGDQGINNFYLYQYGGKDRFVFIPWDKDSTFVSGSWPLYRNLDDERPRREADLRRDEARVLRRRGAPGGDDLRELALAHAAARRGVAADPRRRARRPAQAVHERRWSRPASTACAVSSARGKGTFSPSARAPVRASGPLPPSRPRRSRGRAPRSGPRPSRARSARCSSRAG